MERRLIAGKPYRRLLVAPRPVAEGMKARLEALLALLDGPKTAWELSLHLFPQELDPAGRRFAFAETLAHLEYLREEGAVGRGGPPYRYFRR